MGNTCTISSKVDSSIATREQRLYDGRVDNTSIIQESSFIDREGGASNKRYTKIKNGTPNCFNRQRRLPGHDFRRVGEHVLLRRYECCCISMALSRWREQSSFSLESSLEESEMPAVDEQDPQRPVNTAFYHLLHSRQNLEDSDSLDSMEIERPSSAAEGSSDFARSASSRHSRCYSDDILDETPYVTPEENFPVEGFRPPVCDIDGDLSSDYDGSSSGSSQIRFRPFMSLNSCVSCISQASRADRCLPVSRSDSILETYWRKVNRLSLLTPELKINAI